MKKIVLCLAMFASTYVHGVFEYDRAISAAQKNNLSGASSLLNSVEADHADVLYDKGVVAYRQKNLQEAQQHFLASADHPDAEQDLIERAYFNAGNVAYALKDFTAARDHYKKVLDINQHNSFAEHNLKKAEEMLKKQEEQKKEDNKKEEKDDQHKQDQQQNESSADDKQQESSNQKQQNKKNKQDKSDQQSQSPQDGQQQQKKQEGNGENDPSEQPEHSAQPEQSHGSHKQQQPDEQHPQQKNAEGASEQKNKKGALQQNQADQENKDPATHDEWLAALLEKSNKRDAQENKKMIKAFVKQQMGGNEGQNCW